MFKCISTCYDVSIKTQHSYDKVLGFLEQILTLKTQNNANLVTLIVKCIL